MAVSKKREKKLNGFHVLWMLIAFFGVTVGVNAVFIFSAVTSFRGEDVKGSYRQGLEYNQTLSERAAQDKLGWSVSANYVAEDDKLIVQLKDVDLAAVNVPVIEGILRHPTDLALDRPVVLNPRGQGQYTANVDLPPGQWRLKATALKGDQTFRFDFGFRVL